jgi:hypothetical protein
MTQSIVVVALSYTGKNGTKGVSGSIFGLEIGVLDGSRHFRVGSQLGGAAQSFLWEPRLKKRVERRLKNRFLFNEPFDGQFGIDLTGLR